MKRLVVLVALLLATPVLALDDYGQKSITTGTYCKDITNSEGTAAIIISGTWTGTGTLQRNDTRLLPGTPTTTFGVNATTRAVVSTFTANGTFLLPVAGASQACVNFVPGSGTMTAFIDLSIAPFPGALAVLTDNIASVNGTTVQANNSAAPPAAGLLPAATAIANAVAPTWTEGFEVLQSVDLSGRQRVTGTVANDTTVIANAAETQPAVSRATPTATTAGRSEKEQVSATNGGQFVNIVGGAGTTVADVFAGDTTAAGNGAAVLSAVSRGNTAVTAGRAEYLTVDPSSSGLAATPIANTTASFALSNTPISATASVSVKASAGSLYGFVANNGQATTCWLQCVNSAGAGTLGTAAIISFPLALSTSQPTVLMSDIALANFSTGIACGFSTTANGVTACGTASTATLIFK